MCITGAGVKLTESGLGSWMVINVVPEHLCPTSWSLQWFSKVASSPCRSFIPGIMAVFNACRIKKVFVLFVAHHVL